ncbi:hexose carrier protein [Aspergillus nomiae NRRL 13137]|uniref:Hexose carrier protein n=1 Tax=Aspergillus nomiae NRRL (strain ATCC 15546 / NRRL 13137 / CBS 260.88 / M93) TaxID=1509407 RepID=A0A0L1IUR4_ASPN3|nr:hexose carrier protein [Aspergillus nomiae NRRL 13137]KNG83306.1 hexose carrier protein [Aspergillus nomiae NRRL 13137]
MVASTSTSTKTRRPYLGLTGGWLTLWITIACATDMSLFGYDQGVFGGVVVTGDFLEVHSLIGPRKTSTLSTVTAIYDIGCFSGAVMAFTLGERLGRKKAIMLGTTIMAVGTILQMTSYSLPQIIVGRIVLGAGNGLNTSTAPIWQTETASPQWRGKLVILDMMMNIAGYALVNWINYGLSFHGGAIAWRFPIAFQFIFFFILWGTVPWLPESPRWLMAHQQEAKALEVLSCLEAKPVDHPYITTLRNEIEFSVRYERENSLRWRDLLSRKKSQHDTKTVRRLLLGAGTQFIQQFEGINGLGYYFPTVLINSVGLSNQMARLLAACSATSYLVFSLVGVPLVEKVGRRGCMLISTLGQFVCYLIITVLLSYAESSADGTKYASASISFFFLYFIVFGIGMLGVPWLYPTEINSLQMRTKGAAVATATNWLSNFVIVEITPIGIQNLGWRFYIIWTVLNAAFMPVIYLFYPETANRNLEDMDAYYRSNPALIVTKDPDAISAKRPLKYIQHEDEEIQISKINRSTKVEDLEVEHVE